MSPEYLACYRSTLCLCLVFSHVFLCPAVVLFKDLRLVILVDKKMYYQTLSLLVLYQNIIQFIVYFHIYQVKLKIMQLLNCQFSLPYITSYISGYSLCLCPHQSLIVFNIIKTDTHQSTLHNEFQSSTDSQVVVPGGLLAGV